MLAGALQEPVDGALFVFKVGMCLETLEELGWHHFACDSSNTSTCIRCSSRQCFAVQGATIEEIESFVADVSMSMPI